jgi:hypothetical protein
MKNTEIVAVWSVYLVLGLMVIDVIDYKLTYKFQMKYCLQVNNYKCDNKKFWCYVKI